LQGGRKRLAYGVVGAEVEGFVSGDSFVAEFLARFKSHQRTWWAYASTLYMFFRWMAGKRFFNNTLSHTLKPFSKIQSR
jgi:hypothetical protein